MSVKVHQGCPEWNFFTRNLEDISTDPSPHSFEMKSAGWWKSSELNTVKSDFGTFWTIHWNKKALATTTTTTTTTTTRTISIDKGNDLCCAYDPGSPTRMPNDSYCWWFSKPVYWYGIKKRIRIRIIHRGYITYVMYISTAVSQQFRTTKPKPYRRIMSCPATSSCMAMVRSTFLAPAQRKRTWPVN